MKAVADCLQGWVPAVAVASVPPADGRASARVGRWQGVSARRPMAGRQRASAAAALNSSKAAMALAEYISDGPPPM